MSHIGMKDRFMTNWLLGDNHILYNADASIAVSVRIVDDEVKIYCTPLQGNEVVVASLKLPIDAERPRPHDSVKDLAMTAIVTAFEAGKIARTSEILSKAVEPYRDTSTTPSAYPRKNIPKRTMI